MTDPADIVRTLNAIDGGRRPYNIATGDQIVVTYREPTQAEKAALVAALVLTAERNAAPKKTAPGAGPFTKN